MKRTLILLLALIPALIPAKADEGMWMLNDISKQNMQIMRDLGFELSQKDLYNPKGSSLKDAVVSFGGFCSGVIVSPQGLVFTNHHCGFDNIQALATPDNNILANGFVAQAFADELPAAGLYVRILQRTDDITKRVDKALSKYLKANKAELDTLSADKQETLRAACIDSICLSIEEEYNKKNPSLVCEASAYYQGNAYYINLYLQYDDIRLVCAPPQSLGKFGGETDNWMWPRQTCDFSVFRIYADSLNRPAEYSPRNKPLQTNNYARISLDGFKKGDFCLTVGYPGQTSRYLSSFGITERMNNTNQARINVRGVKQNVWTKWMNADPAVRLQYASKYANSSNYWKNSIGMNKALADLRVVQHKQEAEAQLAVWIEEDNKRKARFGNLLPELQEAYARRADVHHAIAFINESFFAGPDLIRLAFYLKTYYAETDTAAKALWLPFLTQEYKDWNTDVDRETMTALIDNYRAQVEPRFLPPFIYHTIDSAFAGNTRAYVDSLFAHTVLTDSACLLSAPSDSDAALQLEASLRNFCDTITQDIKPSNKTIARNERLLCQAYLEKNIDAPHYSDANSTLRYSYGIVDGYATPAAQMNYFTDLQSLLDKAAQSDSVPDYQIEPEVHNLLAQADPDGYQDQTTGLLQLCFLTNNDITGGNSGSPMFDARGRLIGLAFDGNWDAMSSDVSFNPLLTRCIAVDIRYVLFIIDKWGHAQHLLQETGIR